MLRNLATGETTSSGKQCHGDAVVDQLGPRLLDPSAELAEKCSGGAYVCEVNAGDDGWDPNNCTPWPGDAPTTDDPTGGPATSSDDGGSDPDSGGQNDGLVDHGCACDAGTRGSFEALGLFALGLLRRRRRTRRAR